MFDKIIFYNLFHSGDVFISKSFVKYIVNNVPAKEYVYVHCWGSKILMDIENLGYFHWPDSDFPLTHGERWKILGNDLYINTWIGVDNSKFLSAYNITLLGFHSLFKEGLKEFCGHELVGEPLDFIPDIDFSKFDVSNIDKFMASNSATKRILIDTCLIMSGQSLNFNFSSIIEKIALKFKDYHFFITNYPKEVNLNNVFYCRDITGIDEDIVECAYFGNFCSTIIGRASGAYNYCVTKYNIIENPKKFITFAYNSIPPVFGIFTFQNCVTSEDFSESNIMNIIESNVGER